MRPKGRTTRPTPIRPSSTPRATTHTQKKRKNTSFRLQRELSHSLPLLSVSLYLLTFSHPTPHPPCHTPPLLPPTTAPRLSCQWGTCGRSTERSFKCFPVPLSSFAALPSLSLAAGVLGLRVGTAGAFLSHWSAYLLLTCSRPPPRVSHSTSIRCLQIQTPLNFCQSLHVFSVSCGVKSFVGGQSEVISLL